MIRKVALIMLVLVLTASAAPAQDYIELTFEDYNDQDAFNNILLLCRWGPNRARLMPGTEGSFITS